jgi:VWFA-related protein
MRKLVPTERLAVLTTLLILLLFVTLSPQRKKDFLSSNVLAQTRERKVSNPTLEVVKVDVDLVTVDALVLQKDTARVVGDLKREDFQILEDGKAQEITHFSQNSLPLSVLLMIDRGGCLDAYSWEVRNAAIQAVARLKPTDEVAVMSYHNTTELLQEFTRDRSKVARALSRVPPHDEAANHCINKAFFDAANYMESAGNPVGRRVVIFITGVTRNFDCDNGPGAKEATHAIYESGSVVCGLVPVTPEQKVENGAMRWATRMGGMFKLSTLNIKQIAEDTGGEVLSDKPEILDQTFVTLMEHLRSRFSLAFVSSNKARDGSLRKLKIDLTPDAAKTRGKLVVKARRSYVAPRS